MLLTTIRTDQRACSFIKLMDRRITPDDVDPRLPSQAERPNLPRHSFLDNVDAHSLPQAGHSHLPHQSTPDVDTQSHAGRSRLPRRITPDDVDTRWPFRAGYPRLLRPSVVSIPIKEEKPISDVNFDQLRSRIFEILESYDLSWVAPDPFVAPDPKVVYRRQEFGTSGLARVLINCMYDKDTSYSKKWTKAVAEIYAEIQSVVEGDREVGVELLDMTYMGTSRTCALPTSMAQELSANWEDGHNYCEQILQLFEAPHEMFQVMIPIGTCSLGDFTSTIVFFDALNAEDDSWDSLEERIRSILPSHIGVEIRQRSGPLFSSPQWALDDNVEGYIPSPEEYIQPPRPGCDIGVEGGSSAGTMGGYVVTENEIGKRITYAVTNAHVALQSYEKRYFSASANSSIRMVSPSDVSRAKGRYKLLKDIAEYEEKIQKNKKKIDAWEENDPEQSQRLRKTVRTDELLLGSTKSIYELNEQDSYVGSVQTARLGGIDSSTVSSQCEIMMDLALIKMDMGAKTPQEIYLKENSRLPEIKPNSTCHFWETDSLGVSHDGDGKDHIKVVGKLSRSGAYRLGIVNDFRAVAYPFTENGVKNDKRFYAWTLSHPASIRMEPFSVPGDSGSFVIAAKDWQYYGFDNRVAMPPPQATAETESEPSQVFVVGLQFGSTDNSELTYFIPFDEVKSQIESLTGEEMVWPRKCSDCVRGDMAPVGST